MTDEHTTETPDDGPALVASRRAFLGTAAGAATAAAVPLAALATTPAAAAATPDVAGWLANTEGADAVADHTGEASVTIAVGSQANGGAFGFDPVAVRVDPGTEVVWEWTGDGGVHNVVSEDGAFESEYRSDAGATFSFTPDGPGTHLYSCAPHASMGMKAALVVGDQPVSLEESGAESGTDGASEDAVADGGDGTTDGVDGSSTGNAQRTFDGWLADTSNFSGVVDRRGESRVTVEVGAAGNGGAFAFEPAAVHVDPGTEVVWEWVGDKTYDVVDDAMGYRSETVGGSGYRYGVTFDGHGVSKYACEEYAEFGMKGAVLIGAGEADGVTPAQAAVGGAGLAALAAPLAGLTYLHYRNTTGGRNDGT